MNASTIFWISLGIIYVTILLVVAILKLIDSIKKSSVRKQQAILEQQQTRLREKELFVNYKKEVKESLDSLLNEKSKGFPWLATAIGDYYENFDKIFADYLETKDRPALVQAERIKEIAKEKRLFKKEFLTTKYIIEYYESLFPWLREYVGINSDELIKSIYNEDVPEEADPVSFYMAKSEFEQLSVTERNQKALDRYWNRNKDPWQIGRDYERYIGFLYELDGYKVQYHGIERLKEDLGRDLICTKGNETEVIQCKYWSAHNGIPVRENHIAQLYGTTVKYYLDSNRGSQSGQQTLLPVLVAKHITPVLATTTALSNTAAEFASALGVKVKNIPMDNTYPCIKCNINFQTDEHIYHLPFDQQYDTTKIDPKKGERWARTVIEAENSGFRRAWRWRPPKANDKMGS